METSFHRKKESISNDEETSAAFSSFFSLKSYKYLKKRGKTEKTVFISQS